MLETWVQLLFGEDPMAEGMATHSSILAWKIPWTEEPGGLQFVGSQRVRHYWWADTLMCRIHSDSYWISFRGNSSLFSCTLGMPTEKGSSGISCVCHIELEHDIIIVYVVFFFYPVWCSLSLDWINHPHLMFLLTYRQSLPFKNIMYVNSCTH